MEVERYHSLNNYRFGCTVFNMIYIHSLYCRFYDWLSWKKSHIFIHYIIKCSNMIFQLLYYRITEYSNLKANIENPGSLVYWPVLGLCVLYNLVHHVWCAPRTLSRCYTCWPWHWLLLYNNKKHWLLLVVEQW